MEGRSHWGWDHINGGCAWGQRTCIMWVLCSGVSESSVWQERWQRGWIKWEWIAQDESMRWVYVLIRAYDGGMADEYNMINTKWLRQGGEEVLAGIKSVSANTPICECFHLQQHSSPYIWYFYLLCFLHAWCFLPYCFPADIPQLAAIFVKWEEKNLRLQILYIINVQELCTYILQPAIEVMHHFFYLLQMVHPSLKCSNPGRIASIVAHWWCVAVRMQGLTLLRFEKLWVLRIESATSCTQRIPSPSPPKAAPKPKYSHMVKSTLRPCDPGKPSHDLSCVQSCDTSTTLGSRDIQAHDPGKVSYDLPRDWSSTWS